MEIFTSIIMVVIIAILASAFRILREYERAVVFMLGRFYKIKGPGLIIIIPVIQQMVRVDLRTIVLDIPTQDLITRDNVSVKVNAVLYFRVVDSQRAIINVEQYMEATGQLAQTTLRSVLGQHELDELLAERERLNRDIQGILDQATDQWGIKVSNVEIKHVDIDESMIRAIAKQAEAERERRAKIIHADGEQQAAEKAGGGGEGTQRRGRRHAAPLPADAHGDRRGEEFHHRLPAAGLHDGGVAEPARRRCAGIRFRLTAPTPPLSCAVAGNNHCCTESTVCCARRAGYSTAGGSWAPARASCGSRRSCG